MSVRFLAAFVSLLLGVVGNATAQDAAALANGIGFASSIQPSNASQIVNPSAVNGEAWTSTSVPSSAPSNLGPFSNTDTTANTGLYSSARSLGLATLGNQTMDECATHTTGADPLADQKCAAVNFLANRCLSMTDEQKKILNSTGTGTVPTGCEGSYGAGQQALNITNTVKSTDAIFGVITNAKNGLSTNPDETCTVKTVEVKPAEYETNTCTKSITTEAKSCSQNLNVVVTTIRQAAQTTERCDIGILVTGYCVSTTTQPASPSYSCPAGYTLSGNKCVSDISSPATINYACPSGSTLINGTQCATPTIVGAIINHACPAVAAGSYPVTLIGDQCYVNADEFDGGVSCVSHDMAMGHTGLSRIGLARIDLIWWCIYTSITSKSCPNGSTLVGGQCISTTYSQASIGSYSCPDGTILSGTVCLAQTDAQQNGYTCQAPATLAGTTCETVTQTPPLIDYSCVDGSAPIGGICTYKSASTSWENTCSPYATSSGTILGVPE